MIISYEWLKEFAQLPEVRNVADRLTMAGLEVEAVRNPFAEIPAAIVARVVSMVPHPSAAGMSVCELDAGAQKPPVVCAASNVRAGILVPWLPPGTTTASGRKVEKVAIHGTASLGMLASGEDLGFELASSGIHVLPEGLTVGAALADALGRGAGVLDVNVTPNRGDCLSHLGIAREASAVCGVPLKAPLPCVKESDEPASKVISVEVRDVSGCPRYLARVVRGIKVGSSPEWMSRRLAAAGVRSINNVVDATNYVMLELGHPMHAFDLRQIRDGRIIVRRATAGEKIVTIDGVSRGLSETDLVIADAERPVAVAGVMGGEHSGITPDTTDVVLECACFEPRGTRKTSGRLGLSSESSYRFERGVDAAGLDRAVDRCAELITMTSGGRVLAGVVSSGGPVAAARSARLRPARLALVAGSYVDSSETVRVLSALGIEKKGGDDREIEFLVPTWRPDIALEEDLIEEVLRLRGYDCIAPTLPANKEFVARGRAPREFVSEIRSAMSAAGFSEVVSYSFVAPSLLRTLGISDRPLPVRNPLSEDQSVMRTSLLAGLVLAAQHNVRRRQKTLRLFEVGRVFLPRDKAPLPDEPLRVAGVMIGQRAERSWTEPEAVMDFYDAKGAVEALCASVGVCTIAFSRDALPEYLHPGRAATILAGGVRAGSLGQIHPRLCAAFDLPEASFVFELDAATLENASSGVRTFVPYADFPGVERDIALVVDEAVPAGELQAAVVALGIPEVSGAVVFDVYTGPQVGGGRKNVAIGVTYRATDRTLTDAEVEAIHEKIVASLNERFGGRLR